MIEFGTGGWRAEIGKDFTYENVKIIVKSIIALEMKQEHRSPIAIGYDNRFLSKEMAAFAGDIFRRYGITTYEFEESVPTPVLMFAVKEKGFNFGIMITASHNPYNYNGIKLIVKGGLDAPKEITDNLVLTDFSEIDNIAYAHANQLFFEDYPNEYIQKNLGFIDFDKMAETIKTDQKKYCVYFNGMNGSGSNLFIDILTRLGVPYAVEDVQRDCLFGDGVPEPNIKTTDHFRNQFKARIAKSKAVSPLFDAPKIGVVFDGDGDRLMLLDENGDIIDMNDILCMLYWYLHEIEGLKGGVVYNTCTTFRLKEMAIKFGELCYEVPVGFKWITSKMLETNALLGGESSGGLAFRGHIYGKDSILATLLVLKMMVQTGLSLSELKQKANVCDRHPIQTAVKIDYSTYKQPKEKILELIKEFDFPGVSLKTYNDGVKFYFKDGFSWISYRFSGTEPILRVMTESCCEEPLGEIAVDTLMKALESAAEPKRTCMNCTHYHPVVYCDDSFFHMHDFCEIWKREIPDYSDCDDMSDVERGAACCWCFKQKE